MINAHARALDAWLALPALVRIAVAEARHAAVMAGYWLRPYDFTLDRRRWRWQPNGHTRQAPAVAAILEALDRHQAPVVDCECMLCQHLRRQP